MSSDREKQVFSANLRFYMQKYNRNQNDIASALGVNKSSVSLWVNGQKYPRIDKVQRLADYFGITMADLVEDRTQVFKEQITDPSYAKDMWNRLDDMRTELMIPGATSYKGREIDEQTKEMMLKSIDNLMFMIDTVTEKK